MLVVHSRSVFVGALALTLLPAVGRAQKVGSEFRINTYTTNAQRADGFGGQVLATDASGNFVVFWRSLTQDGDSDGVFGQRYNSSGQKVGTEFRANSFTTGRQGYPSAARADNGNFVVVWDSENQDGSSYGVFGQRYNASGQKLGAEFRVNTQTNSHQRFPAVAADPDGHFVVAWNSYNQDGSGYGIFAQRYDNSGTKRGAEFRVNTTTASNQRFPSLASDAGGNFVVVWGSNNQDGNGYGVFGQRFDSAGVKQGGEFRVNTYTTSLQKFASVASDPDGNFVVVWNSFMQDGSGYGVFGQRFDSGGTKVGGEFKVSTYTPNDQWFPAVASDDVGNFIVTWHSELQDGSVDGVFGKAYNGSGNPQGGEFRVNTFTNSYQLFPSVAAMGTNEFVVSWQSLAQDGDSWGVFGQRYDFGGGGNPTIHVGDLDRKAKNQDSDWRAQVKTLVHDNGHAPESGVLVTFNVTPGVGTRTCTTVASGVCEVSVVVGDNVASLTFTVTNLSKTGFTYTPAANHDPDTDSDGTVIVVRQP
jgi:hypothetical protein